MIQTLRIEPDREEFLRTLSSLFYRLAKEIETGNLVYFQGDLYVTQFDESGEVRLFGDMRLVRRTQPHQHVEGVDIVDAEFREIVDRQRTLEQDL